MGSGADATKANWQALVRLAGKLFSDLRRENPDWSFEDLEEHLGLPETRRFRELAREAGFESDRALSAGDQNKILKALLREVFSPAAIARETKLPAAKVKAFLDEIGVPFGAGGWGMFPWPGKADSADEDAPAPTAQRRRVTTKGQFRYRGRTYGIGSSYGGRVCWVEEAGNRLVIHFADRKPLMLCK